MILETLLVIGILSVIVGVIIAASEGEALALIVAPLGVFIFLSILVATVVCAFWLLSLVFDLIAAVV